MIVPVILCGGSGSHLWPVSRESSPKQFQCFSGQNTLFQDTLTRAESIPGMSGIIVVCNEDQRFTVKEQIEDIGANVDEIILEQMGRNTLPAIAAAAVSRSPNDLMLVLPADHHIADTEAFSQTVLKAVTVARDGALVCFGAVPSKPETGYGYIIPGREHEGLCPDNGVRSVREFIEKPDYDNATFLVQEGAFWNSRMFMFKASTILEEIRLHHPRIYHYCREARRHCSPDNGFFTMKAGFLRECPSISIDYGVMEHTLDAVVIGLQSDWSDVGSWDGVHESLKGPSGGNTLRGDVMIDDVKNSCVISNSRLVAAIGLDNHIVVETADAVLVARRDNTQQVKDMVAALKDANRPEAASHWKVERPWGFFECLETTDSVQVKRLVIDPGARLSLQRHEFRSEHCVVVSGTAKVVNGEHRFELAPSQSTFIPAMTIHQLENPGPEVLEIIEVQTGSYFGEDDIERFEDDYGRVRAQNLPLRAVS